MNHTPHILASLFLCGMWLPIWALIAFTYDARFHCSQCGHSDATRYLASPHLRSQEAERSAIHKEAAQDYFESFKAWYLELDTTARAIVFSLIALPFLFFVMFVGINQKQNSIPTSNANKPSNAIATVPSTTPAVAVSSPIPYPSQQPPNPKFVQKLDTCSSIESELASVESDQAGVERMLDATEDFGDQAGSPKKAIYLNALKRKGELQLQHIALERKLKACGKRK